MSSFDNSFSQNAYLEALSIIETIEYRSALLLEHLTTLSKRDIRMAFDIATIVAAAQKELTLVASVKAAFAAQNAKLVDLSNQLTTLTAAAGQLDENTKAQLQSVADQLNASNVDLDSLVNAVVTNTPAAPVVAPVTTDTTSATDTTSTTGTTA